MKKSIIQFTYQGKGKVVEIFDFETNTQTIVTEVKRSTYNHPSNFILAFYITELLRELRKRDIHYTQQLGTSRLIGTIQ